MKNPYIIQSSTYKYASFSPDLQQREREDETGESSEEVGQLTGPAALETSSAIPIGRYASNRHTFFRPAAAVNERRHFNNFSLKPELTPEEKELLMVFLKALDLNFAEFNLKLFELKMSLKTFTRNLKENLALVGVLSPKDSPDFISKLINHGLVPETLLEKLQSKELQDKQQHAYKRSMAFQR